VAVALCAFRSVVFEKETRKVTRNIHVLHMLEGTVGGTARHLLAVCEVLPSVGISPSFLVSPLRAPNFPGTLGNALQHTAGEGGNVTPLCMRRSISPLHDLYTLRKMIHFTRRCSPDIIHTHSSKAGFLGRLCAHYLGIPVVHTPHVFAVEWANSALSAGFYGFLERIAQKWTDKLVALHDGQVELAIDLLEYSPSQVSCIPNGVNLTCFTRPSLDEIHSARVRFELPEKRVIVGMAARLVAQKGVSNFLQAARLVLNEHPRTIFLIAGSGELQETLRIRCQEMGTGDSIRFLGEIEHMPEFYHAMDVFVLASLWEGMPYVILEAQASGLPVVASATRGARELVESGGTGLLSPLNNIEGLAMAISTLVGDEHTRHKFGIRARAFVEQNHDVKEWGRAHASLYQRILSPSD